MTTDSVEHEQIREQVAPSARFKGEERALRADRLGTGGLLLSVLAATAPLMVVAAA
ncbi:hypothetical protein SVIOM342S_05978 [Streptomyces violaceorubidus]